MGERCTHALRVAAWALFLFSLVSANLALLPSGSVDAACAVPEKAPTPQEDLEGKPNVVMARPECRVKRRPTPMSVVVPQAAVSAPRPRAALPRPAEMAGLNGCGCPLTC